jgi:hypothetical protein
MYANKDAIAKKKKEDLVMNQKQMLNDILIEAYKETMIQDFGLIVRKLTANQITLTKAISEAKQLCSIHNCMNFVTKLDSIKQKE